MRTFANNHVKVEKSQRDSATYNNKRWFGGNLHVLKGAWNMGRIVKLLVVQTVFLSYQKNDATCVYTFKDNSAFSNLSTRFPTPQKHFGSYWRMFQIVPYPPSHPKELEINVCKHKFACTNATPKRRNVALNSCAILRISNKHKAPIFKRI